MMTDRTPAVTPTARNVRPLPTLTRSMTPAKYCPTHHTALDEGPVKYRCPDGHAVYAADLDHEFHPTGRAAA